jgi:hypothetical protein
MKHNLSFSFNAVVLSLALLLGLAAPIMAQDQGDPAGQKDPALECVPYAALLAETMDVTCDELMVLHAEGIGFGRMMMAWQLSQTLPDYDGTWADLLAAHLTGEGWGQTMMAYRVAAVLDLNPETTLALKEAGLPWAKIGHAQALANANLDITFKEAVVLIQEGSSWADMRDALGLENVPPPWVGGPEWSGSPPISIHANNTGDWDGGPPPWHHNEQDVEDGPPWDGGPPAWQGGGRN